MTITPPEEILSPAEEWLRAGQFTPAEATLGGVIHERGTQAEELVGAALGIGAAFVLYRRYMSRKLREETARMQTMTQVELIQKLADIFQVFAPRWILIVVPSLISGYQQGLREAGQVELSEPWLAQVANAHAKALGEHIHEVSGQALIEGFQAQVNRRVAARQALDRVIDAYGVAPRTMKTLVNIWTTPPNPKTPITTSQPMPNRTADRADALIADSLQRRAQAIGETEAYSAKAQAKQVLWLYWQQEGVLPRTATKEWITAEDERVCPSCGPLHRKRVPVAEQFVVAPGVRVWGPALHPNCRCDMILRANVMAEITRGDVALAKSAWGVVSKARPGDPYDRDAQGRFAPTESRPTKTRTQMDPEVARVVRAAMSDERAQARPLAEVLQRLGVEGRAQTTERAKATGKASVTGKATVGGKASVGGPKAQTPQAQKATLRGASTSNASLARAKASLARFEESAKFKAPDLRAQHSDRQPSNDIWTNTPDGQPMFGIFDPITNAWHENGMLYSDDQVEWYTGGTHGRGVPTLEQGVKNYWDDILSKDNMDRMFRNAMDDYGAIEASNVPGDINGLIAVAIDDGEIYVDRELYEQAWKASVLGLGLDEAPMVHVPASTLIFDRDEQEYYVGEEDVIPISLYDLGTLLNIHHRKADMVPIVGASRYIRTDADGYWGGIMGIPGGGKWRILNPIEGGQQAWRARSAEESYPYVAYVIEPDDLFD